MPRKDANDSKCIHIYLMVFKRFQMSKIEVLETHFNFSFTKSSRSVFSLQHAP